MTSIKIFLSIVAITAFLGAATTSAQCPAGWTAVGPVNVYVMCNGVSTPVAVWYCFFYPAAPNDTTCKIQLSKVCGACPGLSQEDLFDSVLAQWSTTANPLNLEATNRAPCELVHYWTFSRPMCIWQPDPQVNCFEVCGGNTSYKCTKTYSACYDDHTGLWVVTYVSTVTEGSGPCQGSCTTGSCP